MLEGGIDGNIYTDSLEALNQSYQNETRLFDIDLRLLRMMNCTEA